MYLATAAIAASLFATIMAPSPVHADIVLPLGKNEKGNHHVFETTVSFKTNEDVACTPEQLALIEEAMILSCNESHEAATFHMDQMAIKEATHGPMLEVEKAFLRASGKRYNAWYGGSGGYKCKFCNPDDDRRFLMDVDIALAKGGKVKEWENTLCAILGQYDAFDGASDCQIKVHWNKEEAHANANDEASTLKKLNMEE
jgi:hypothetical protein